MAGLNKQDYVDRAVERAEGERPRHLHRADQGALSVPVELGFLPDRARPAAFRRGPRLDRDRDAVRAPVAGRHGPAHRLPRRTTTAISPAPTSGAPGGRSRPPASPSRPSPASRCGGSSTRAADRERAAERARALLPKIDAWHRWFYENRDPERRGPGRDHPPLGVGPRQLDRLGRGLRARADRWRRALRAPRHPACRPGAPADQGAVRPLHLAGAAVPRARLGQFQAARRLAVPDRRPGLQRHPDPRLRRSRRPGRRARRAGRSRRRTAPAPRRAWRRWSGCGASRTGSISASTASPASSSTAPRSAACCRPSPPCRRRAPRRWRARSSGWRARRAYIVPSHDPADPRFDSKRYWRGPVWLVVNYMIADGLARAGETAVAERITRVEPRADRRERLCRILRPALRRAARRRPLHLDRGDGARVRRADGGGGVRVNESILTIFLSICVVHELCMKCASNKSP